MIAGLERLLRGRRREDEDEDGEAVSPTFATDIPHPTNEADDAERERRRRAQMLAIQRLQRGGV